MLCPNWGFRVKGPMHGTQLAAALMTAAGINGHIINVSSMAAVAPVAGVTLCECQNELNRSSQQGNSGPCNMAHNATIEHSTSHLAMFHVPTNSACQFCPALRTFGMLRECELYSSPTPQTPRRTANTASHNRAPRRHNRRCGGQVWLCCDCAVTVL